MPSWWSSGAPNGDCSFDEHAGGTNKCYREAKLASGTYGNECYVRHVQSVLTYKHKGI